MPVTVETVRKGDKGTAFIITLVDADDDPIDVSAATTKQIKMESPSGVVKTFTASFVGTGADGEIQYITAATTDIDEVGDWGIQAYIVTASGTWHSAMGTFRVQRTAS